MDKKILGRRIQEARKKKGFSQERMEEVLGLPQKAMTRIESGERAISTLELAKLAELFHMSIVDFLEAPFEEDLLIALHRVAHGLKKDPVIKNEVDRCVHIYREGTLLEQLLDIDTKPCALSYPYPVPSTIPEAIKQGEQAAKEERRRIELGSLPIHNIVELLRAQGLWCASTPLPKEMSGLFLQHPSLGRAILVNSEHAQVRQRFSFAHEYAHALFDSKERILISTIESSTDLIEKRANAFAAAFLLPEEGIAEMLRSFGKGLSSRTSFSVFDVATQGVVDAEERKTAREQKLSPPDIALIAHHFGVSYIATVYRLHSLRYLSQKEREEALEEESSGKKYLQILKLEDCKNKDGYLQQELKTHVSRLIIEAYKQEKISRGRVLELCKLLQLPAQTILDLANTEN